ncbi:MAG: YraN family protein [Coriobacteriia bacterium]|jgi:putative endonuclease|nr:YraN family protein [Coriobacteriia bacterium]MDR2714323.1 YraN family protein [Coriobacteriales bacterium]
MEHAEVPMEARAGAVMERPVEGEKSRETRNQTRNLERKSLSPARTIKKPVAPPASRAKNAAASPARNTKKAKEIGRKGEEVACLYLAENNIQILERNWRCGAGEADVIAREGDDLAFIEVKTRSSLNLGFPEDAITRDKRSKYERIALHYLAAHAQPSSRVRFDVIAVVLIEEAQALLRHHRDAFGVGE